MIPTLLLVTIIVFFSVRFIPGNIVDLMVAEMQSMGIGSQEAQYATAQNVKESLGLDVPVYTQYGRWMGVLPQPDTGSFSGVLQGNLGRSLWRGNPVTEDIFQRLPISLELGFLALMIKLLTAIPLGVYSAIRQDTVGDYTGRTIAILFISIPTFWLGTMVTVYPSIWWNWSPPIQYIPPFENPIGNLAQFLLPAFIMGMFAAGTTMRMTRTMMLEVLRQDYIRTAWAKGLTERTIILRHAMKNALIPVVTIIGLALPGLVAGAVVIETIFNLPGIGQLLIQALNSRDYPIISGLNLFVASTVLIINLLVDLSYAYLDPRVRYQ